jgi:hypothetical protein
MNTGPGSRRVYKCEHGRQKGRCMQCGGTCICEHGRDKRYCKQCGGPGICEHGRDKRYCKQCGGPGICEHGRDKRYCKECKGQPHTPQQERHRRKGDSRPKPGPKLTIKKESSFTRITEEREKPLPKKRFPRKGPERPAPPTHSIKRVKPESR